MTNEVYSLESVRSVIRKFIRIVSVLFPDDSAKVVVKEGGWTSDRPWFLIVAPSPKERMKLRSTFKANEMKIDPQVMMDYIDHGGGMTENDYAAGMFSHLCDELVQASNNPEKYAHDIRVRMEGAIAQLGPKASIDVN